ncbi:ABC transporter permease [Rhodococcus sp. 15-725-2-2b]|jgi:ABC-2 type transport system permease protein|uniref:ABC transporter permease n=1 Tax=unclassified Rhodococcus (in: high G+C Gram-positive bacteria) TaxID=192944 RepID=UPI000B9B9212|nr:MULTISPECIES: ABC transporter permease [unclassified Rhodococcus (in: high G+C Gram-positive bacteria)]OZC72722.1 ABC transporter permease [Rhodococcus sp. 06-469-3-2]OZD48949.1 ABC transporter permease [Rhodococcus sp. 06-1477-1A]OZE03131.1 ABC transporter permease [Rhodococcus sp. 05-2255-3C]OZE09521.1 ABC transporter permease [Rhodococcus sp. 05-2255-3B1]OZE14787.1 ABC transporter permease [Rhodococcus sp. 05-2255-2A2]
MSSQLNSFSAVSLIAKREFTVQVMKKSFVISNAIILAVIVGGIVAFSIFSGSGDEERDVVGIAGDQSIAAVVEATGDAVGSPVEVREIADAAAARSGVESGDLDVALVPDGTDGAYTAVTESDLTGTLRAVVEGSVATQATNAALAQQGVDQNELGAATSAATVTVDAIDPPDPEAGQRTALALSAVFLLYAQIIGFGMYVAMGVVEEKSSRVVELLLSTVRPLQLLWGKILGIGAVGIVQLALYGIAGVGAGLGTGVLTVTGAAVSVFAATLAWFVLGFAFFAVLYAAGGSMVSRQEDVNSTTMPLLILIMAMFFAAFYSVSDPESTLANTLSWIPPFSAIMMPLRIAAGVTSPVQIVGSAVLMVVTTAILAMGAAKIYQRSILRIGKTVSWKEAFAR